MLRVIIAGHRRSGNHFTRDALLNNYDVFENDEVSSGKLGLDHFKPGSPAHEGLEGEERTLLDRSLLFSTHSTGDPPRFFGADDHVAQWIRELLDGARIIHVHRDGRDVLTSLYHYMSGYNDTIKNMSFCDFIRMPNNFDRDSYGGEMSRVEFWRHHVESWLARDDVLNVSYEGLARDYHGTLSRMAAFLDFAPRRHYVNVRLKSRRSPFESLVYRLDENSILRRVYNRLVYGGSYVDQTPVCFRKGVVGDSRNHFSSEDNAYFNDVAGDLLKCLDYELR